MAKLRGFSAFTFTGNCIIYPPARDDCINKPTSLVADFDKVTETAEMAFEGRQIQPILSR